MSEADEKLIPNAEGYWWYEDTAGNRHVELVGRSLMRGRLYIGMLRDLATSTPYPDGPYAFARWIGPVATFDRSARDAAEIAALREFAAAYYERTTHVYYANPDAHPEEQNIYRLYEVARSLAGPEIPPDPRDATIAELRAEIDELKTLTFRGKAIANLQATIDELDDTLTQRDATIARLEAKPTAHQKFRAWAEADKNHRSRYFMPSRSDAEYESNQNVIRLRDEAMAD